MLAHGLGHGLVQGLRILLEAEPPNRSKDERTVRNFESPTDLGSFVSARRAKFGGVHRIVDDVNAISGNPQLLHRKGCFIVGDIDCGADPAENAFYEIIEGCPASFRSAHAVIGVCSIKESGLDPGERQRTPQDASLRAM